MKNYRIINDYKVINKPNLYACNIEIKDLKNIEIKDLKSNLYYLVWVDDYSAICFDRNPSSPKGTGYMRLFGEACVFEEDDIIPYIYS